MVLDDVVEVRSQLGQSDKQVAVVGAARSAGVVGAIVDGLMLRTDSVETDLDAALDEWPATAAWAAIGAVARAGRSPLRRRDDARYFSAYSANCIS